jgi:hypothetical protein
VNDVRPPGPVRASRVERRVRAHRRRRGEALVTVLVVLSVGSYAWVQAKNYSVGAPKPSSSASPSNASLGGGPPQFLALSVTGSAQPLLAMVGVSGSGQPTALSVPMGLTMVVPGAGEMQAKDVGHLAGPSMRLALSNLVGAWADHWLVTDLDRLATLIDRTGGLNANLTQIFVIDTGGLGPGPTTLDGAQVRALLSTQGTEAQAAWGAVLTALLQHPPTLERNDVAGTDSFSAAQRALGRATGAGVIAIPTAIVASSAIVAAQPDLDALMTKTFGTVAPVSVILQNGSGFAGVGALVSRRILPAGFRVVVSGNASTFDHAKTTIVANGVANVKASKRLRRALGVGLIRLSRVTSGIGDITVVVGKDFKA